MYKAIINKLKALHDKAKASKAASQNESDQRYLDGCEFTAWEAMQAVESLQRAEFEFFWTPDPRKPGLMHCNRNGGVYVGSISHVDGKPYNLSIRLLDRDVEKACMGASLEDAKSYVERKHTELFSRIQAYLNGEDY